MKMAVFNENPNISADVADVAEPMSLTEFTLFPNLPIELRFIILRLSLEDRVIEIHCRSQSLPYFFTETRVPAILHLNREYRKEGLTIYKILESSNRYINNICSRHQTDGEAARVFANSRTSVEQSAASSDATVLVESPVEFVFQPFRVYINYAQDIIYLHEEHSYRISGRKACLDLLTQSTGTDSIQTIAFQPDFISYSYRRHGNPKQTVDYGNELSKLKNLRKVTIVNRRQGSRCCEFHAKYFLKQHSVAVEILGPKGYMSKNNNEIKYEDTGDAKLCREFFHQIYKNAVVAHNSTIPDPKDRAYLRFDETSYQLQGADPESDKEVFENLGLGDHEARYPLSPGDYDTIRFARSGYDREAGIHAVPSKILGMPHVVPGTVVRK